MGLDIYFHKCKRGNYERYEKAHKEWQEQQPESSKIHNDDYEKLPEEEKAKIQKELRAWWDKEPTMKDYEIGDIGYFRKVNFLMAFFNYYENCSFKKVSKAELEDLRERCYKVLHAPKKERQEVAEDLLPTQSGFFYGSTEYDNYYFDDVKEVKKWVEEVIENLNDETEEVLMYCWY